MLQQAKSLIVLLGIASVVYFLVRSTIIQFGVDASALRTRMRALAVMTVGVFLCGEFWFAMVIVGLVAHWAAQRDDNPVALYMLLLIGMPFITDLVSGLGLVGHLVQVHHGRILSLVILLPMAVRLYQDSKVPRYGHYLPEKFQLGYFGLMFILTLDAGTFLGVVRAAVVYPLLDAVLVTFVAARMLRSPEKLWDLMGTLLLSALMLSAIAVFESLRKWLLYSGLHESLLGFAAPMGSYSMRGETLLRALGSTDGPIILGCVIMTGLLCAAAGAGRISPYRLFGLLLLLTAGSVATVSRGPWVGILSGLLVLCLVSRYRLHLTLALAVLAALAAPLLMFTKIGTELVQLLPFIGDAESESVSYRMQLLEVAYQVVQSNPFFGAYDFLLRPEMEQLRQGQGIIDLVNTYVGVVLRGGLVGLILFVGAYLAAIAYGFRAYKSSSASDLARAAAAQSLLACLVALMVTIYTVSPVGVIPYLCWVVIGASIAARHTVAPSVPAVKVA